MNRYSLLVLPAALWFTAATGEIYHWVDDQGVTHYSQTPAPSGTVTRLAEPAPDPVGNSDTLERMNQQLEQMQERQEVRREQEAEQREDEQLQARRQANCEAAKRNLDILGPTRRLIKTPGEDYRRLTEEERQARIREHEEIIARDCD